MKAYHHCIAQLEVQNEVLWNFLDTEMVSYELANPTGKGYYVTSTDLIFYLDSFIDYMYRRYNEMIPKDRRTIEELQHEVDTLRLNTKIEAVLFINGVF